MRNFSETTITAAVLERLGPIRRRHGSRPSVRRWSGTCTPSCREVRPTGSRVGGRYRVPDPHRPDVLGDRGRNSSSCPTRWASRCWSTPSTTRSRRVPRRRPCWVRSMSRIRRRCRWVPTSPHGEGGEPLAGARVESAVRTARRSPARWDRHLAFGCRWLLRRSDAARRADLSLRARLRTDAQGRFWFRSDRAVAATRSRTTARSGRCWRHKARHPYRPAHVHFMIGAEGCETLVTHIFIDGDRYLDSDVVFGVKDELIRGLEHLHVRYDARRARDRRADRSPALRFRARPGQNGKAELAAYSAASACDARRARQTASAPRGSA